MKFWPMLEKLPDATSLPALWKFLIDFTLVYGDMFLTFLAIGICLVLMDKLARPFTQIEKPSYLQSEEEKEMAQTQTREDNNVNSGYKHSVGRKIKRVGVALTQLVMLVGIATVTMYAHLGPSFQPLEPVDLQGRTYVVTHVQVSEIQESPSKNTNAISATINEVLSNAGGRGSNSVALSTVKQLMLWNATVVVGVPDEHTKTQVGKELDDTLRVHCKPTDSHSSRLSSSEDVSFPCSGSYELLLADLTDFKSCRQFSQEILRRHSKIHGLALTGDYYPKAGYALTSQDKIEKTYQANQLSQFLILHLLRNRLQESAPARVTFMGSDLYWARTINRHRYMKNHLDHFGPDKFSPFEAYSNAKLMNLLTAREAQRRFNREFPVTDSSSSSSSSIDNDGNGNAGVIVNVACPGLVSHESRQQQTAGFRSVSENSSRSGSEESSGEENRNQHRYGAAWLKDRMKMLLTRSPEEGAIRLLQGLVSPVSSESRGEFLYAYLPLPYPAQVNPRMEKWVWEQSASIVGVDPL